VPADYGEAAERGQLIGNSAAGPHLSRDEYKRCCVHGLINRAWSSSCGAASVGGQTVAAVAVDERGADLSRGCRARVCTEGWRQHEEVATVAVATCASRECAGNWT